MAASDTLCLKLYQFPISHYCEKARWALQFKKATFREINVAPGLHKLIIKANASAVSPPITVPVLVSPNQAIQGSGAIISYLDREFPENPLGFVDESLNRQAADLESFLDETAATLLRSIAYHILLKHPKTLTRFWSHYGPFYTRAWLKLSMPMLTRIIRQMYRTDTEYIADHLRSFDAAMDRLDSCCEAGPFLIGERFSRVDLTLAAVLAPLHFPQQHPYPNPAPLPDEYQEFCTKHAQRPVLKRVQELYRKFR